MFKILLNKESDLFEARLIRVLTELPHLNNGLGNLALALEVQTGKTWNKKKLYYMLKGEGYAKQWQLEAMLRMALINNWLPTNMDDWMHIIWTITGKKQSAQGGYNGEIYQKLAELSDKSELIFEENYKKLME
jgi:hypothetical protein